MAHREFQGSRRQLILAFDIGTTFSGISYSILDPGATPQIKGVTRFPAVDQYGASKIPTIIYYDKRGKVRAIGAEATREGIFEESQDEKWIKAEWFKLHLRSEFGEGQNISSQIPSLPSNKTVVDVFADFLKYLLECSKSYIEDTHANGPALWTSVEENIHFVLSHPNGWEGMEQFQMRKAAVLAGLVPDTPPGHARISFVTEGEASLHFAIEDGVLTNIMKDGEGVVIVDAGGGTIDISSYKATQLDSKHTYEEIAPPQCHFHGSIFVSIHAKVYLEKYLNDSVFNNDIDHIVHCFDKTTKLRFRNANDPQYVKFGSTNDNDPGHNIRFGQLKLDGSDVAKFFEPSERCIVATVLKQRETSNEQIKHVVLVGGFAANDWLFNSLQQSLSTFGFTVHRPENYVNKAVSNGSISFYLDHYVRSRVSKFTYGNICDTVFDANNTEHIARSKDKHVYNSGMIVIRDYFSIILPKETRVSETKEFRMDYRRETSKKSDFKRASFTIWCYRGAISNPKWKDLDPKNYTKLCTIELDLSHLPLTCLQKPSGSGTYFALVYTIILLFGMTELKAQVAWKDDGVEKRSPAKIIYDPDSTNNSKSFFWPFK